MLNYTKRFNICCLLDSHEYSSSIYECLLGVGSIEMVEGVEGTALASLEKFRLAHHDWIFGHLSYELKNEIELLDSAFPPGIGFPALFFFVPRVVVILRTNQVLIGSFENDHDEIFYALSSGISIEFSVSEMIALKSRFSEAEYIETVVKLKSHILRGDCYEINFCQEFYSENAHVDPVIIYKKLARLSPNPFAAFYKLNNYYCICQSPERFLKKTGDEITSQPIKGTAARNAKNELADIENLEDLSSPKERSENVMIVDLVRNDLSRICKEGSVKVEELFGIYPFPQVYQMISTITGIVDKDMPIDQILRATFPMGSMTGAPKLKVMKLIDLYERSSRGLFSGSIGYVSPSNDFDFNVVIRSILYDSDDNYLSVHAGSAITFYSDPKKEYAECLLKISAMMKVLE